jgi:exopolyphosphatase/guanosine-5'-triphosphate,3'-diphosphate pyrophosphatase
MEKIKILLADDHDIIIDGIKAMLINNTEIEIIANVDRYHRKSHPKKSHESFNQLSEKNKNIVRQLSAILRVGDALDRTHKNCITDFTTIIYSEKVEIKLQTNENVDVELWSLERRKSLFEEEFNRSINVVT